MIFALDSTGDLAVESNRLVLLTDPTAETAQRLTSKFRFVYGEWFLNTQAGLDYFGRILVKPFNPVAVRVLFRQVLEQDENVASVVSLVLDFDAQTRALSLSFEAALLSGGTLTVKDFVLREKK